MAVVVITGGTLVHVSPHFALCAPAFGRVGREIAARLPEATLVRTAMSNSGQPSEDERVLLARAGIDRLETNADLGALLDHLVADSNTRCIVLAAAVCDWDPVALELGDATLSHFGKSIARLRTADGNATLTLTPSDKLLSRVRRDGLHLVAFKATAGLEPEETASAGRALLERARASLVLANDVQRETNAVVSAQNVSFGATREDALDELCTIIRRLVASA